jgi:predicted translin family RNA/ssDNA-binding protein
MLNKKFIQDLKKEYDARNGERRQIISRSNMALHDAKRIIFSLHRGDSDRATELLTAVEELLTGLEKQFGFLRIKEEGAYNAAVEEYVEAKMFFRITNGEKIDKIKKITVGHESYLGGICDLTGELVRKAVNMAAKGDFKEVEKIKEMIGDIMAELVEFDMTGYMRTKYDQARGNLKKIEQVSYEINLRK